MRSIPSGGWTSSPGRGRLLEGVLISGVLVSAFRTKAIQDRPLASSGRYRGRVDLHGATYDQTRRTAPTATLRAAESATCRFGRLHTQSPGLATQIASPGFADDQGSGRAIIGRPAGWMRLPLPTNVGRCQARWQPRAAFGDLAPLLASRERVVLTVARLTPLVRRDLPGGHRLTGRASGKPRGLRRAARRCGQPTRTPPPSSASVAAGLAADGRERERRPLDGTALLPGSAVATGGVPPREPRAVSAVKSPPAVRRSRTPLAGSEQRAGRQLVDSSPTRCLATPEPGLMTKVDD
jgi:hypothetical protein